MAFAWLFLAYYLFFRAQCCIAYWKKCESHKDNKEKKEIYREFERIFNKVSPNFTFASKEEKKEFREYKNLLNYFIMR
jgi:hypothetical protein